MDERLWTDRALEVGGAWAVPGCRIARPPARCQTLISGDLPAALAALSVEGPCLGFAEAPAGADHAICIGQDQALVITQARPTLSAGWHAPGFALTEAGGAFQALSLTGPDAFDVLAHGLAAPPPAGSPSAALLFAGVRALVTGDADALSLWVQSADLPYVTSFLARSLPSA